MKASKYSVLLVFLLLPFFLTGNAVAKGPFAHPWIPDIPDEWTPVYPADLYPEFEFNGLSPACSNAAGTESDEFYFYVKRGKVNNLVVYFQGGGACWDPITCLSVKPFTPDVTEADNPVNYHGIFDFENEENPFKDWSFVFVPYCTGDIHWGANDKTYTLTTLVDGQVVTLTGTIQHRGFVNFLVVLKWMRESIRRPHKIFVTGSSAGAYGAIGGFPWIKEAYPRAQVSVLGDAGMGVSPPEYTQLSRPNWNTQIAPWLFETEEEFPTVPEIWARNADYYHHSKLAQYTNAFDGTQIAFYNFMFVTLGMMPPADPALDWHTRMWEGLDFNALAPNYRYYVAPGTAHTILAGDGFYDETSDDGIRFRDWVAAMVKDQGKKCGHGVKTWVNTACDACRY